MLKTGADLSIVEAFRKPNLEQAIKVPQFHPSFAGEEKQLAWSLGSK